MIIPSKTDLDGNVSSIYVLLRDHLIISITTIDEYESSCHNDSKSKGVYIIDLSGKSEIQCELHFCPQTVCF